MPLNRLANEKSPYLLQHADNPVAWYPWGEEAFAAARRENKPIFLSIGYSTCHWCHVMNRESFNNPVVADFLNRHFISIKLDREERPDVDRVFMTFVQATTGGGGWPMSVWLTPDLFPLVGGTYFPPEDAWGRPGFLTVLQRVADAWAHEEKALRAQAAEAVARLRQWTAWEPAGAEADHPSGVSLLAAARAHLTARFDARHGGFGAAPKFPRPSELMLLFGEAHRLGPDSDPGRHALEMAVVTLDKMMCGGIHDHLGGGFHRYSVDAQWHIPHYEKMLYDQAQLATAYLTAFQLTGRHDFADTVRDILDYVARDLTAPAGGFYSAEDADSLAPGAQHKSEGAFYLWRAAEIERLLGADAALFAAVYGVTPDGNAPPESDPHGMLAGTNTLIRRLTDEEAGTRFGLAAHAVAAKLAAARATLFAARAQRPRPHRDDKIIAAWNGLMIGAFARAAIVLESRACLETAQRAAAFLRTHLYEPETGLLWRSWRGGPSAARGFAEDYACVIDGLLDLYEAGFDFRWLEWAVALQQRQDDLFWDPAQGGYFSSTDAEPGVFLRLKEDYDGAEPCASSLAAHNLLRLGSLLGDPAYRDRAGRVLRALTPRLQQAPLALPLGLGALAKFLAPAQHIVIVGDGDAPATRQMLRLIRARFRPGTTTVLIADQAARDFFARFAGFYRDLKPVHDQPTALVCQDCACSLPTTSVAELAARIDNAEPAAP